ncbi:hypothetical protein GBAR_LOCUS17296 [Geodia barretti]|uniref:Uncharacterized protein n=1 Tax=Geodia barretti TaxID=519541 RepID=A0AA35SIC4_GEOBA|nr:hypothetical protein GBAR_LOCUS17296 [Geodia barretti]
MTSEISSTWTPLAGRVPRRRRHWCRERRNCGREVLGHVETGAVTLDIAGRKVVEEHSEIGRCWPLYILWIAHFCTGRGKNVGQGLEKGAENKGEADKAVQFTGRRESV